MLLITEVKDCHDGNVEELSRKLEALTQEIQTLKQKAETSAGDKEFVSLEDFGKEIEIIDGKINQYTELLSDLESKVLTGVSVKPPKLMSYNEVMALVENRQDETYRQIVDDTETFPPGTFRHIYHERLGEICAIPSQRVRHGVLAQVLTACLGVYEDEDQYSSAEKWESATKVANGLAKSPSDIFSKLLDSMRYTKLYGSTDDEVVQKLLRRMIEKDKAEYLKPDEDLYGLEGLYGLEDGSGVELSSLGETTVEVVTFSLERLRTAFALFLIEDRVDAERLVYQSFSVEV